MISAIPREQNLTQCNRFLITYRTELKFLAHKYRFVYCLDMSPSNANVDIQKGEILFDEILNCFGASLEGLCKEVRTNFMYFYKMYSREEFLWRMLKV